MCSDVTTRKKKNLWFYDRGMKKKKPAVFFQGHADFKPIGFRFGPPHRTDVVFTVISEPHFQVSDIKKQTGVGFGFGFSY